MLANICPRQRDKSLGCAMCPCPYLHAVYFCHPPSPPPPPPYKFPYPFLSYAPPSPEGRDSRHDSFVSRKTCNSPEKGDACRFFLKKIKGEILGTFVIEQFCRKKSSLFCFQPWVVCEYVQCLCVVFSSVHICMYGVLALFRFRLRSCGKCKVADWREKTPIIVVEIFFWN